MITHQPTPEQLERLEQARLGVSHTDAAVAEARAVLAQALAEHAEANRELSLAITTVLYGPENANVDRRLRTARELSSPLAQEHWPSPPPATPGG